MLKITIEATSGTASYTVIPDERLGDMMFYNSDVYKYEISFPGNSASEMVAALRAIAQTIEESQAAGHPMHSAFAGTTSDSITALQQHDL